jgi:carbon monoxide dehydrogenase subunit G
MLRVERSTIVKAPPEACAAFLAEPTNFAKIDRKVRDMKIVERGEGFAVVSISGLFGGFFPYWLRFRMDRQADGGLLIKDLSGPLREFNAIFTLAPTREGTRVTHVEAYEFYGPLKGVADKLFSPFVARVVEEELYRFRRFVEEGWETQIPWD